MSQITITTDSEDLQNRLISFGQAYSAITDLELEADTDIDLANEISGALIDKLLEETEESAQQSVPEAPKMPIGYAVVNKISRKLQVSKVFHQEEFGGTYIRSFFTKEQAKDLEVIPVYS